MEMPSTIALLKKISNFSLLSPSDNMKSELVQTYYREIDEILQLLEPVLRNILASVHAVDESLVKLLEEVDVFINEARELMDNWHQMTSKVYFVVQVESLVAKIQTSVVETCRALCSLFPSDEFKSCSEDIEGCLQKNHSRSCWKISNVIKEAMLELGKDGIPRSEHLSKITQYLCLFTNQDLLMEIVALDKLKTNFSRNDNLGDMEYADRLLALICHMHDSYVEQNQVQNSNDVPIPADFCCPLSLQLMSDPVIVASGQTYERAFIRKWIDQGFTVCPKTRQTLVHTNLIPNYTVKALIANWCETNNIKLPDPAKSTGLPQASNFLARADISADESNPSRSGHPSRSSQSRSPESRSEINSTRNVRNINGPHPETRVDEKSTSSYHLPSQSINGIVANIENSTLDISLAKNKSEKDHTDSQDQTSSQHVKDCSSSGDEHSQVCHLSASTSSAILGANCKNLHGAGDGSSFPFTSSNLTSGGSDGSGEVTQDVPAPSVPSRDAEFPLRLGESRSRNQTVWRRPSERFSPRIISSPTLEIRPDLSDVERKVRQFIEELKSDSIDVQKSATSELRLLAKHNSDNRIVIASCGAIPHLVSLLHSPDLKTQENAVTALLNLSLNDNNKIAIASADAVDPLIHVLRTGNAEAKENAAATFYSLSVIEENKVKIGRSGAIVPLVELLSNGTPRGKRDASTALYNLSLSPENKPRIVQAGAVKHLVELMDPAAGMVEKAVSVLANLTTITEGRIAIGREGGIPLLVEVIELGSPKGKENAAAALLQLCSHSTRFQNQVLQEDAVPPLIALSLSGTARAKEKAQALLSLFRSHRHNNGGRP